MNSIDNQRVTPKNPKITGNKPEIKNKPYMTQYDDKIPGNQQKEHNPQSPQYLPANACNLQKRMALIINHLSIKTHENTGNKPEINNKPNVTIKRQHPTTHNL